MGSKPQPCCPRCGAHLDTLTLTDWVQPEHDPEGKARADLILECDECGYTLNAFVPFDAFEPVENGA